MSRWILRRNDWIDEDVELLEERGNRRGGRGPLTAGEELRLEEVRRFVVHRGDVVQRSPHDPGGGRREESGDGERAATGQRSADGVPVTLVPPNSRNKKDGDCGKKYFRYPEHGPVAVRVRSERS